MFGTRGEKVRGGEKLSKKRAQRVGENVKDAVNAGMGEEVEELEEYFASGDDFGVDPGMAANIAAVNTVAGMFDDDERTRKKILKKWEEKRARKERENSWNNFVGKALKAKENEVGSMLTDEEREEEKRAELEKKVVEKARGNKGFLRVKRKVIAGLVGSLAGITMFLSACGVSTEKGVHVANTMTMWNEDDEDDGNSDGEVITAEMAGEGGSSEELERPAGVSPGADEEGLKTMRSLEEILELSKDLDFSQITPAELEMVGRDEALTAEFESAEESRVLENGLQVNYANGYYSPDKTGKNKFGPSAVEAYGDSEATADSMMRAYFSQPQELAAGVVDFESVLRAAGVDEEVIAIDGVLERAQAVYEQMLNREDGGDLQARLRGALKIALMSDRTSFNFYYENRAENSFYLRALDKSTTESPETNLVLMGNELQRHGAKQVQIVLDFGDHQETMDYNLDCGWQPNWNEHWRPKQEIVKVTPEEPEVPETPEEPERPEEPEEPETPPEEPETPPEEPETPPEEPERPEEPEEPETPPEEIKEKNPDGQKEVVDSGIHTNPVGQTPNVDGMTGDGIQTPSNETPENKIPQDQITGNTTGTYEVTGEPVIGDANGDGKVTGAETGAEGSEEGDEEFGEGASGSSSASGTDYTGAVANGAISDPTLSAGEQESADREQERAEEEEQTGDLDSEQAAEAIKNFADGLFGVAKSGESQEGSGESENVSDAENANNATN